MSSPVAITPPPAAASLPSLSASASGPASPASCSGDRPNTPVPDELADVRAKIKALEEREGELRRLLLTNPDLRTGAHYIAEIKTVTQERTDLKEMRAMHPQLFEEFTFPLTVERVVLMGVTEDGEIVSARKLKATKD